MKEKSILKTIKSILGNEYIGDDCAYLKELGIVVTHDSLVEDVHFKRDWITPEQLGYKSIAVNISDICASGAEPKYLTISLSLPPEIDEEFIKEFYKGAVEAAGEAKIVGGDITGGDKIFVSVAAIGASAGRKISSRAHAKIGQKIIVSGEHGSCAASNFKKLYLNSVAECEFSKQISTQISDDYAMMDTSDGLMDALSQIATASGVVLSVEFDKIPYNKDIEQCKNWKDLVLYGGEDYQLVATVPENLLPSLKNYHVIGVVKPSNRENNAILRDAQNDENNLSTMYGVELDGEFLTPEDIEGKIYDHFKS